MEFMIIKVKEFDNQIAISEKEHKRPFRVTSFIKRSKPKKPGYRLDSLIEQASILANQKGHRLYPFNRWADQNGASTHCFDCYAGLNLKVNPGPREKEISGLALQLFCQRGK
jgi:hypothetical protein